MQQGKPGTPIVYEAFDLLEVEGEPLVDLPLSERRRRLEALLDRRNRDRPALGGVRGRCRAVRGGAGAGARGDRRQARGLAVPGGQADARVAEDQDPRPAGVRDRRLHERPGAAQRPASARSSSASGEGDELEYAGNVGTGFTDRDIDELLAKLRPLETEPATVSRGPEDAEGQEGRRGLGQARAGRRGRVRRVDARRPAARSVLPGAARGQVGARGAPRGAAPERDPPRQARRSSSRTSTRSSGRTRASPRATCSRYYRSVAPVAHSAHPRPAVHDEALPRRDQRRALLPEGRAAAHARLDPDASRSRRPRASSRGGRGRSRRRSSTTSSRCSGW